MDETTRKKIEQEVDELVKFHLEQKRSEAFAAFQKGVEYGLLDRKFETVEEAFKAFWTSRIKV